MPQSPGTRLGPYEIVAPLGAGGMGEVYRARDTRLGRDVAIKVLPQHLSASPEVRSRFEREARTVSSLNHPHICTLHDVGREGDTDYLVMELVEGETLAERLNRGPLPAAELLKLGAQIADALDRAHRVGIVHRDLKPGNVMLTKSGAKLMDFGLARATGLAGGAGSGVSMTGLSQSPTQAQPLTAEGTIVGTFQYMSPEQLEGKEADARSDLWALGCVLYEMATGRRPFEGRSQASLITAIMGSEPPPVSQVAPLAPAGLDRLIRTCLHKDPDERVQTAHDVKLQLLGIAEGSSQAGASAAPAQRSATRVAWTVAAIAALAAVSLAFALMMQPRAPKRPVQLSLTPPAQTQFTARTSTIAVSPNGEAVAFCAYDTSGQFGLWTQRLDAPDPIRIASTVGPGMVFWSADSRTIGYNDLGMGRLRAFPVAGGTPVTLATIRGAGRGGAWSHKGVVLFAPRARGPLYRVSATGGEPVPATWLDSTRHEANHRFPCFLPDGDHFLYAALPQGPGGFPIYAGSLSSRSVEKVMDAESAPTYAEPGYLLFRRAGKVMAQRFDPRRRKLQGEPFTLADAPPFSDVDAEPVATASKDGRLVYLVAESPALQMVWLDRSGAQVARLTLPPDQWGRPMLSPDDRFAVVPKGNELWRVDVARSVAVRLGSGSDSNLLPVWSPDGRRIAYPAESAGGREDIFAISSDGSGEPQLLASNSDLFKWPECWVPAGLVFQSIGEQTGPDIWIAPPAGPPKPLIRTPYGEYGSSVSPDGRWIAYLSNEAGLEDVYIQSFPEPGHKVRVSTTGARVVWWMPGSDELCYRSSSGAEMMSVKLTRNGEELEPGEPKSLFRYPLDAQLSDFAHDGRRVLITMPAPGAQKRRVRVVLDWTALAGR